MYGRRQQLELGANRWAESEPYAYTNRLRIGLQTLSREPAV